MPVFILSSQNFLVLFFIAFSSSFKTLSKYTDFGKNKKVEKEKQERTFSSNDDVPMLNDGPKELLYKTPKIETSFGGSRIGEVYEHPTKN